MASRFGEYLQTVGVTDAGKVDEALAQRFVASLRLRGPFQYAPRATRLVLEDLRRRGVLPCREGPPTKMGSVTLLLERYRRYLADVRGLAPSTIMEYVRGAKRILTWLRPRRRAVRAIRGRDVLAFVGDLAREQSTRCWRNRITSQTRIFLRFLRWDGVIENDLAFAVPKLRSWQLASVPRHLPWESVRQLIESIDTTTPTGKRDKAVLLLIALLGMRGEEVRTLELKHVAWRSGEIRLPRTKTQRAKVLPLPQEVGVALAAYILHGRPRVSSPTVFLRHAAPRCPLSEPAAVSRIVARCIIRAGIPDPGRPGVHLLRHSLATRMVNSGVPIKQIADVLGHRSINTTAIYTKVDLIHLAEVALPFPGEKSA
jgi:site-specific recombinase XerD